MLELRSVDDVRKHRPRIVEQVSKNAFVPLRGLFDREKVRSKLGALYRFANTAQRLSSAGVSPTAIQGNVVKWSIGGHSTTQTGLPRMMTTVYNPLFAEDIHALHADFRRLMEIRDVLAMRPATLSDAALAPDRWNGCRVQIYPAGGGSMGAHGDTRGVNNLPREAGPFIQMLLLLTERGVDYKAGGAFIELDGKQVDSEAETKSGDVLVYDGATIHGVADIDPTAVFDGTNLRGRAVALVTIYDKR